MRCSARIPTSTATTATLADLLVHRKFLGDKKIVATFRREIPPSTARAAGTSSIAQGGATCGWSRVSKQEQYAYGKRPFIDKEIYFVAHSIFDKAGQLWKVWLNNWDSAKGPRRRTARPTTPRCRGRAA
jgi:hypothetical protein